MPWILISGIFSALFVKLHFLESKHIIKVNEQLFGKYGVGKFYAANIRII